MRNTNIGLIGRMMAFLEQELEAERQRVESINELLMHKRDLLSELDGLDVYGRITINLDNLNEFRYAANRLKGKDKAFSRRMLKTIGSGYEVTRIK